MKEVDSLKAIIDSLSTIQNSIPVNVVDTLSSSQSDMDLYIFTSLGTLLIGVFILITYMRHNTKSVKPLLRIDQDWDEENFIFKLELSNHGLGPAIVTSSEFFWNNKKFETHSNFVNDLMDSTNNSEAIHSKIDFLQQNLPKNFPIQQNSSVTLLEIRFESLIEEHMIKGKVILPKNEYLFKGDVTTIKDEFTAKEIAMCDIDDLLIEKLTYNMEYKCIYNKKMEPIKFPN